jgi:hypothetical protein
MQKKVLVSIGVLILIISSISLCVSDNGERARKNLDMEIKEANYYYSLQSTHSSFLEPSSGSRFLVILVTVKNLDNYRHEITADDFYLKDSNGSKYYAMEEQFKLDNEQLINTKIDGGNSTTQFLIFEVPESAVPARLYCKPSWSKEVFDIIDPNKIIPIIEPEPTISANVNDRTSYWKIEIVTAGGKLLALNSVKFQLFSRSGTSLFTRTTANINPTTALTSGESAIYPIPSGIGPVYENATTGDGATIDAASVAYPERWEGCYFAYVDAQNDNKITSGDSIWVFKDWNEDNTDDVTPGFNFKILDSENNEILNKEF